jgi:hypothetical protein
MTDSPPDWAKDPPASPRFGPPETVRGPKYVHCIQNPDGKFWILTVIFTVIFKIRGPSTCNRKRAPMENSPGAKGKT